LENSKLDDEYVRIGYLSKYSKYAEGLLINMSCFYIHRGLPCAPHVRSYRLPTALSHASSRRVASALRQSITWT
jgi:hypothetical protein